MTFIWFNSETRTLYEPRPISAPNRSRVEHAQAVSPVTQTVPQVGQERQRNRAYEEAASHERVRAASAKDIMSSPVVTLAASDLFADAWRLVHEWDHRHIPIVSDSSRPLGIVADRDLLLSIAELETNPGAMALEELMQTKLQTVMRSPVLTAVPTTSIREVARVMFEERVGCVPIVSESEEIVGIVTRSDILRAVLNDAPMELWI